MTEFAFSVALNLRCALLDSTNTRRECTPHNCANHRIVLSRSFLTRSGILFGPIKASGAPRLCGARNSYAIASLCVCVALSNVLRNACQKKEKPSNRLKMSLFWFSKHVTGGGGGFFHYT